MNKKTLTIAIAYFLVAISVVTYYPTLFNHIINWNDTDLFNTVSAVMKGKAGLFSQREYPPLALAIFVFQRSFSDYGYFLFHAVSMLFHAASAVLLFFIIRRLFVSQRIALIVSILFSVHPIQVETVAWLSTQNIVTSTFFFLLTCSSYIRYKQEGKSYFWGLSLLFSAIFYSIATPALSLVLLIIGIDLLNDLKVGYAQVKQKGMIFFFWCVSFLFGVVRNGGWNYLSQLYYDSTAMVRLGIVEGALRILYPFQNKLVMSADEITGKSLMYGETIYPLIFLVIAVLIFWNKKRYPVAFYGFAFLIITSLPVLTGRTDGDWVLSDHSFYLSSVGLFLIIGSLLDIVLSKVGKRRGILWGAYTLCGCMVVALACSARIKAEYWKDNTTFWNKAHDENPENTFILTKRGMYYYSKFDIQRSLENFDKVVELAPEDEQSYLTRGLVHLDAVDIDSAISDFRKAIQLRPSDPLAYFDLGVAYGKYAKFDSAKTAYSKALELNPTFTQALNSRANAFAKTGNYVLAFADYRRALELNPEYAEVYGNRAFTFLQAGNFQQALQDFKKQIDLVPNRIDVKIHYGYTSLLIGDTIGALSSFSAALNIDSTNGKIYLLGVSKMFLRSEEEIKIGGRIFLRLGLQ